MKILKLIGVADGLLQSTISLTEFRDQTSDGTTLGVSEVPSTLRKKYGQPAAGVKRTAINLTLKRRLIELGIELREGWKLEGIDETNTGVIARFEGNRRAEGEFLVGSDGIKAASRELLLEQKGIKEGIPSYTGLTQVWSPITQDNT